MVGTPAGRGLGCSWGAGSGPLAGWGRARGSGRSPISPLHRGAGLITVPKARALRRAKAARRQDRGNKHASPRAPPSTRVYTAACPAPTAPQHGLAQPGLHRSGPRSHPAEAPAAGTLPGTRHGSPHKGPLHTTPIPTPMWGCSAHGPAQVAPPGPGPEQLYESRRECGQPLLSARSTGLGVWPACSPHSTDPANRQEQVSLSPFAVRLVFLS